VLTSDEIQVNTGDEILGNMTRIGAGSSTWYIGGTDVQSSQNTYLTVTRDTLVHQPWAYNTAECYGCSDCTTEPDNPIHFTKLQLIRNGQQVTPQWVTHTSPNPICNERAVVNGPDSVDIFFQQS